jgi:hypothetical protein
MEERVKQEIVRQTASGRSFPSRPLSRHLNGKRAIHRFGSQRGLGVPLTAARPNTPSDYDARNAALPFKLA